MQVLVDIHGDIDQVSLEKMREQAFKKAKITMDIPN